MEITKEGAQSLPDKIPNAELYLKEAKTKLLALVQVRTRQRTFN